MTQIIKSCGTVKTHRAERPLKRQKRGAKFCFSLIGGRAFSMHNYITLL